MGRQEDLSLILSIHLQNPDITVMLVIPPLGGKDKQKPSPRLPANLGKLVSSRSQCETMSQQSRYMTPEGQ